MAGQKFPGPQNKAWGVLGPSWCHKKAEPQCSHGSRLHSQKALLQNEPTVPPAILEAGGQLRSHFTDEALTAQRGERKLSFEAEDT